jgi:hypothetical protein
MIISLKGKIYLRMYLLETYETTVRFNMVAYLHEDCYLQGTFLI